MGCARRRLRGSQLGEAGALTTSQLLIIYHRSTDWTGAMLTPVRRLSYVRFRHFTILVLISTHLPSAPLSRFSFFIASDEYQTFCAIKLCV
jgi:hypothetical protein